MSLLTLLFLLFQVCRFHSVQALSVARDTIDRSSSIEKLDFSQNPHTINSASEFQVEFEVPYERQRITLNLQPSRNVVSRLTTIEHITSNEKHDLNSQSPFLYKGAAFVNDIEKQTQRMVGWARVMLRHRQGRHMIEGTFTNDGTYHHISLDSNYLRTRQLPDSQIEKRSSQMIVWKNSNDDHDSTLTQRSPSDEPNCQAQRPNDRRRQFPSGDDAQNEDKDTPDRHLLARQSVNDWFDPRDVIGSTEGCPSSRRVALIGVAADCSYTAEFGSMQDARDNIISQINTASQVYEDTFNIALAIQNLTLADPSCPSNAPKSMPWNLPCTANVDMSDRLNLFTQWRSRLRDDNAVWSLFTTCRSGSTVGIAWIGSLCNRSRASWRGGGTASANVVVRTASEWQVFAHELAHNFGASHDCTSGNCGTSGYSPSDDCCPRSESTCDARNQYLMNPSSSPGLEEFSPCTIGTICTVIGEEHVDTSCLVSEDDVPDVNDSQCGNGIVEPGESCDCGGEDRCPEDSCCNPSTCQLRSGAECDPSTDGCCTDECRVARSGLICRESTDSCDPEEVCDGSSAQCPIDEQNCTEDEDSRGSGVSGGSWFDRNRTAVIATSASVGGVILLLLACVIFSCIRKRRTRQKGVQLQSGNISDGSNAPALNNTTGVTQLPSAPRLVHRYA